MHPGRWLLAVCLAAPLGAVPTTQDGPLADAVMVRVAIGLRDTAPTDWQGTFRVEGGRLVGVQGIRFGEGDTVGLDGAFRLRTRRRQPQTAAERQRGRDALPMQPAAVELTIAGTGPTSQLVITVGDREMAAPLGAARQQGLRGDVRVEALAPSRLILDQPDFSDFAAAATATDGTVHAVWVSFTPHPDFRQRPQPQDRPERFDAYDDSPGGDQLWAATRRDGIWSEPRPVTDARADLYRPAVAVDGQGRVWAFWSQHVDADATLTDGDWELFARDISPGAEGRPVRLTNARGADVFPSAATDEAGLIHLVWMGFRDNESRILALRLANGRPTAEETVANSPRSDWMPTVCAGPGGRVAAVWDSYETGSYDVRASFLENGAWQPAVTVSGGAEGEMNAHATFDAAGRLWVVYEVSPPGWGKDFGALEKTGVPLFDGRGIGCRVLAGGQLLEPAQPLAAAFPDPGPRQRPPEALPRVGLDGAGRVWVTARTRSGNRVAPGMVFWSEATCYTGAAWSPKQVVSGTDATLDNRPVLLPAAGGVLLVGSTDQRNSTTPARDRLVEALIRGGGAGDPELRPATAPTATFAADDEPADIARMRAYRYTLGGATYQILRGEFHRHTEVSSDGGNDGSLLDMWRYGLDAADMDWIGNGDHDNGNGREYTWWLTQKTTSIFSHPPRFVPMWTYERSVNYPDGHRNVMFGRRGVRPLPRLQGGLGRDLDDDPAARRPSTPDTLMLYDYLKQFGGLCASHTSGTDMGTDWRDNDPVAEPIVEIYQGDRQNYERPGAPRSNSRGDSIGGWRPLGFVNLALLRGYRLGFQASSDHISTHMSYCNVLATAPTREAMLEAIRARRVYGATDNIVADYRCAVGGRDHLMGEEFDADGPPTLRIHLEGSEPIARAIIIRDDEVVYEREFGQPTVDFEWQDQQPKRGQTAYYYVRGEQADGELVWISPMWIRVR